MELFDVTLKMNFRQSQKNNKSVRATRTEYTKKNLDVYVKFTICSFSSPQGAAFAIF